MLEKILGALAGYGPLGLICVLFVLYIREKDRLIALKDSKLEQSHHEKISLQREHQDQIIKLGEKTIELNKELSIALKDTGELPVNKEVDK